MELQSRGHIFNIETDTEVIAKLIGECYNNNGCTLVKEATEQALASAMVLGDFASCKLIVRINLSSPGMDLRVLLELDPIVPSLLPKHLHLIDTQGILSV